MCFVQKMIYFFFQHRTLVFTANKSRFRGLPCSTSQVDFGPWRGRRLRKKIKLGGIMNLVAELIAAFLTNLFSSSLVLGSSTLMNHIFNCFSHNNFCNIFQCNNQTKFLLCKRGTLSGHTRGFVGIISMTIRPPPPEGACA